MLTTEAETGKSIIIEKERTKSHAGYHTLKMPLIVAECLYSCRKWQLDNYALDQSAYCKAYIGYICVDRKGKRFHPNYVTKTYKKHLLHNDFKIVRFHDLRHSCGSFLGRHKYNVGAIMKWLAHASPTSSNRYTHFDMSVKEEIAEEFQFALSPEKDQNKK